MAAPTERRIPFSVSAHSDDTIVLFEHSKKMANALKNAGKPYEFITLRKEDHNLSKAETRKQMLSEAMRFTQEHNPAD